MCGQIGAELSCEKVSCYSLGLKSADSNKMKLFLTIIISAMQVLIVIVPLKKEQASKKYGLLNLSKRVYFVAVCCLIAFACTIVLYNLVDNEVQASKSKFENDLRSELQKANEKYVSKLDSNKLQTIEVLAKYGLKVDSAQTRIEKLVKDSANRVTKIYNSEDPDFSMYSIETVKQNRDTLTLKISYSSSDATSYAVNFIVDVLYIDTDNHFRFFEKNYTPLAPNLILNKDKVISMDLIFVSPPETDNIIFHVKGSYFKFDKKKIILDKFYSYQISEAKFGTMGPQKYNEFKNEVLNVK